MMRLISRLKHRDVGIFIITSFFEQQVQSELIEDRHPVRLVSGGDIARILIKHELTDLTPNGKLTAWLEGVRASAREIVRSAGGGDAAPRDSGGRRPGSFALRVILNG